MPAAVQTPTWIAPLTPPGTGAIATLAVRGPAAWTVVQSLFRTSGDSKTSLAGPPEPGRFWLGRLGEQADAMAADQVVLAVKRVEPFPWLEIHCHGGVEVVRWILEGFEARGVEACSWQELERRTTDDPARATAAAALVQATTVRTAGILLDQYHGAFQRAVEQVRAALDQADVAAATRLLDDLVRYADLGQHLTVPWKVAILGAPNVGKSSLVNALAGYQRSVVAATPGTTRDIVTTVIAVDGWPIELSDTAGLREEAGPLEEEGIRRARTAAGNADLCLWVLDAAAPPVWPPFSADEVRLVVNKVDLPAAWDLGRANDGIKVSARTGEGLSGLCEALARWLVPEPPAAGAAVPFTPTLCAAVAEAAACCRAGQTEETQRLLEAI